MNDGELGFGVDDTNCLGLSDDEDEPRAPRVCSHGEDSTAGTAAACPNRPPAAAALGSGQLAQKALEMLRKTPRAATSQPPPEAADAPLALATTPRPPQVASQVPPPTPGREPSRPAVALAPQPSLPPQPFLQPPPGGIPGPAGSISPDAALVPPTQFLRVPNKRKRLSRAFDEDRAARDEDFGGDRSCGDANFGIQHGAGGIGNQDNDYNDDNDGDNDGEGKRGAGDAALILQSKLGARPAERGAGAGGGAVDEAVFREGAWVAMLRAVRAHPFGAHRFATSVGRVLAGGYREKAGELAVAVRQCADHGGAVRLALADVTGAIDGVLARGAALQHPDVVPGAVLVLRSVSVFSTSPHCHHLNILASNIARVFPPGAPAGDVLPLAAELAIPTQRRMLYLPDSASSASASALSDSSPPARPLSSTSSSSSGDARPLAPNRLRIEPTGTLQRRPPATPLAKAPPKSPSKSPSKPPAKPLVPHPTPEAATQRFRGTIAPVVASTPGGSQTVVIAAKPRTPVIVAPGAAAAGTTTTASSQRGQGSPSHTQTQTPMQTQMLSQGRVAPVVVGTPLCRSTPARPVLVSHPFTPGARPVVHERATSSPPRTQTIVIARTPGARTPTAAPPSAPPAQQPPPQTGDEEADFDAFLDSVL